MHLEQLLLNGFTRRLPRSIFVIYTICVYIVAFIPHNRSLKEVVMIHIRHHTQVEWVIKKNVIDTPLLFGWIKREDESVALVRKPAVCRHTVCIRWKLMNTTLYSVVQMFDFIASSIPSMIRLFSSPALLPETIYNISKINIKLKKNISATHTVLNCKTLVLWYDINNEALVPCLLQLWFHALWKRNSAAKTLIDFPTTWSYAFPSSSLFTPNTLNLLSSYYPYILCNMIAHN